MSLNKKGEDNSEVSEGVIEEAINKILKTTNTTIGRSPFGVNRKHRRSLHHAATHGEYNPLDFEKEIIMERYHKLGKEAYPWAFGSFKDDIKGMKRRALNK